MSAPTSSSDCQGCRTILIIEDDQDVRETMMNVLEDEGYAVEGAANGKEGLTKLAAIEQPCLILLDLMMPIMTGIEFLNHLRKNDILAPIPVVVVSAWPKGVPLAPDIQGFVKKPVDLHLLLELVGKYCGVEGSVGL